MPRQIEVNLAQRGLDLRAMMVDDAEKEGDKGGDGGGQRVDTVRAYALGAVGRRGHEVGLGNGLMENKAVVGILDL
jgi:hypothetical protein